MSNVADEIIGQRYEWSPYDGEYIPKDDGTYCEIDGVLVPAYTALKIINRTLRHNTKQLNAAISRMTVG